MITQRFYLSLRNTAVPMLFLFELSCILHIGTLLLFMVRDYFFYFNIFIVWQPFYKSNKVLEARAVS